MKYKVSKLAKEFKIQEEWYLNAQIVQAKTNVVMDECIETESSTNCSPISNFKSKIFKHYFIKEKWQQRLYFSIERIYFPPEKESEKCSKRISFVCYIPKTCNNSTNKNLLRAFGRSLLVTFF
jgi:hypothetical protein